MIRGFVRGLTRVSRFNRNFRTFADDAANAPALGKQAGEQGESGMMRYVNGELVRRSDLTLKKKEDIEGEYFRTTNKSGVTLDSSLQDHGLDSLDSIEISMRIEEELGYLISAETLPVLQKVKHFVNYISHVEAFKEKHGKRPLP